MRKLRRAGNKGTRKLVILQLPLEGLVVGRKLSLLFRIPLKGPHNTPQHGENGLLARTEWPLGRTRRESLVFDFK